MVCFSTNVITHYIRINVQQGLEPKLVFLLRHVSHRTFSFGQHQWYICYCFMLGLKTTLSNCLGFHILGGKYGARCRVAHYPKTGVNNWRVHCNGLGCFETRPILSGQCTYSTAVYTAAYGLEL